ncbi:MAG TPA: serine hydrolase domain-containing protein [Longimicrobium sp.]|nr:serine hydrolase domain-containing protein [Longimicrobium sp.]
MSAQDTAYAGVQRAAAELMRTSGTPGVAVVVVRGDRVDFARGFGVADVETGAPMRTDLLAQIGSVTKPMTAALVLTLAHEGRLDAGVPVGRYVQGLAPRLAGIPLGRLLSQSSGLAEMPGDDGTREESQLLAFARTLGDTIAMLPPGTSFSYSNLNFSLAGLAAQQAADTPFADLLDARLLQPLGMRRTTFRPMLAMTWPRAAGHAGRPGEAATVVRPLADDSRIWPAGYLFSSADEVARFMAALMNGGRVGGVQAIPAAVVDSMLRPRVHVPSMRDSLRYGYGLFFDVQRGRENAWHAGTLRGYSAVMRFLPVERVGVVVIGNRDGVRMDRIAEAAIADALRASGIDLDGPAQPEPGPAVALSRAEMARYTGRYAGRFTAQVVARDGGLVLRRLNQELPLVPLGNHRFTVQSPGAPRRDVLVIIPPEGDRIGYMQMWLWTLPRVADAGR